MWLGFKLHLMLINMSQLTNLTQCTSHTAFRSSEYTEQLTFITLLNHSNATSHLRVQTAQATKNNTVALHNTVLIQSVDTPLKPTWLIVYQNFTCYTRIRVTEILVICSTTSTNVQIFLPTQKLHISLQEIHCSWLSCIIMSKVKAQILTCMGIKHL
jgi:hypothetical protein